MKFTKTSFKSATLPAVAALLLSTVGSQAAVVSSYVLQVEGGASAVNFGSAYAVNNTTGNFQHVSNASYSDTSGMTIHSGADWVANLGATTGSMQIDIHDTGDISYGGCSGFLSTMCNGSYNFAYAESLVSSDGYSFISQLDQNGLTYVDDGTYVWDMGDHSFFQAGYGVSVTYDVTASSLSAVPLPASLAFLMGGFGLLLGFRKRSNG